MDKGCGYHQAYHIPLLPSYLCYLAAGQRNGHLHGEQDAGTYQCAHNADIYKGGG